MEKHTRLYEAWKRSNLTKQQCVERWGWNPHSFRGHLNGNATFGFERAKEYGAAFRVRAEWLYDGQEPMLPDREPVRKPQAIPLISWVAAGGLVSIADIDQTEAGVEITISGLPTGDYFATIVQGDSMDRVSPDGACVIVNAADKHLLRGKPYLFSHNGAATYKLWEPEPMPHLVPHSTNPANRPIFLTNGDWSVIGRVYRSIVDLA